MLPYTRMISFFLLVLLLQLLNGINCDFGNFSCYNFPVSTKPDVHDDYYRLFGTKTTYMKAREEMKILFDPTWPVDTNKCSPVYLFFLSRHSIRYPKAKQITELRNFLQPLRDSLIASGTLNKDLFKAFMNWKFRMVEADDNHVSLSGIHETAKIAKIFYNYFPSLLDINHINFDVGVTFKIRTTETADAFIDSLIKEQINEKTPSEKQSHLIQEIKNHKFVKVEKDILLSHKKCNSLIEKNGHLPDSYEDHERLIQSKIINRLITNFSIRNKLQYTITFDSISLIYKICSYETAINNFSPWCYLFTTPELKLFEYLLDIKKYHKTYDLEAHRKLACTVVNDLNSKLHSIIEKQSFNTNTTLYFSHENLLAKIFSFFGLFKDFPLYQERDDHLCLPDGRQWHSSALVPFGTNFAAILYKCDTKPNGQFKLLTLVNEVPVTIRGCKQSLCDINDFFNEYKHLQNNCDLNDICKI